MCATDQCTDRATYIDPGGKMKLAMKHMLSDFLILLAAHQVTQRALWHGAALWRVLVSRVRTWRPDPFAEWPRQREW